MQSTGETVWVLFEISEAMLLINTALTIDQQQPVCSHFTFTQLTGNVINN